MSDFIQQFSLKGKKAIVTGGAKGLCNGMAQALHDAGAEVVLLDILDMVDESAKRMAENGPMVHAVRGDLSKTEGLKELYQKCLEKLGGRVDILLNGAGIQFRAPAVEFPHDRWEKIVAINMNAVFYLSQLAGKTMLEQKYGKIINIASMTSFFASVLIPAYSASKAGVAQITKALSNEWASQGVNVNAIAPGYMATELTANMKEVNPKQYDEITSRIPMGRWGKMEDLQGLTVFLASDASAYISGAVIPVDGGFMGK
ncbi:SDR family oxidoreductase [Faecalicatena sp. AGMB00832]|uniref:SDR family oxidoreductase n=1 Tax=Faecalicatena faecalis TaxID=2726362 RepID=A0ABS6D9L5_9FIRM|nr:MULTISPECIES: SDR family oxidoreductase [Faecalicatena]MBU3878295.1 SDR family oxidoreductase [Faecalicatena faecalis]MCI6464920.1 SDR family oxidoreductase [Faecalicatena sp.]